MPEKKPAQQLAEQACNLLSECFPNLEFDHDDANDFFDDYHGGCFPYYTGITPVWFEEGRLIYWEAPKQYYWDPKALDLEETDEDEVQSNFLFIHKKGYITSVDSSTGEMHRLMATPDCNQLVAYIQLHFEAGRQQLQHIGAMFAPAIKQISIPFFNFPDDFSQTHQTMPVVPMDTIRDVIFRHISNNQPWLFGMNDLSPELRQLMDAIETQMPNFDAPSQEFSLEDDYGEISDKEFIYKLTADAQERIEAERPNIIEDARALPPEKFDWDWQDKPHLLWNHPSSDLGGNSEMSYGYYPICLLLSESVFPPILSGNYSQAAYSEIFKVVSKHIQSSHVLEEPIPLNLPPYEEQVLNCFLQTVLIDQATMLAKKAMDSGKTKSGSFEDSLRRRREVTKYLMRQI